MKPTSPAGPLFVPQRRSPLKLRSATVEHFSDAVKTVASAHEELIDAIDRIANDELNYDERPSDQKEPLVADLDSIRHILRGVDELINRAFAPYDPSVVQAVADANDVCPHCGSDFDNDEDDFCSGNRLPANTECPGDVDYND